MKTKLVIFGITGDLSRRKLLPALEQIYATGDFADLSVIGVSRGEVDLEALLLRSVGSTDSRGRYRIHSMNLAAADDYRGLAETIDLQADEQLIIYLSVPPAATTQIIEFLGRANLNTANVKLMIEKPFGFDLESARDRTERITEHFSEDQIYRIDHYLAKEMAQNIVAFRGGNALFSEIWNATFVESIEIIATESIGIEGRTEFYEQAGALRDLVQGHLMQLLALTLMDIPHDFNWDELPERRLRAIEQLQPANPQLVVRGQYASYQDEVANPGSQTETFVSLQLASEQPRWQGVPITLTTGKALDKKATEVRINLRKLHEAQSNCIIFRIQPFEGIGIELFAKKPGYDRAFERQELRFDYPEGTRLPDAYEQVIVDAIRSQKSLFTEGREVIAAWRILQPIQDAWAMDSQPLHLYEAGATPESIR